MRTSSPGCAVLERPPGPRLRIDELRIHEAARTEVHAVLLLALSPERYADVADTHGLGDSRAPPILELRTERRLPAAGLARDENALHARAAKVDPAVDCRLDEMGRVRRSEHRRLRSQALDREQQPLRVPRPDGNVKRPIRSKAARAAPATKGPALYVETMRCPAVRPDAA